MIFVAASRIEMMMKINPIKVLLEKVIQGTHQVPEKGKKLAFHILNIISFFKHIEFFNFLKALINSIVAVTAVQIKRHRNKDVNIGIIGMDRDMWESILEKKKFEYIFFF